MSKDAIRSVSRTVQRYFLKRKKKPKKSTDLIGTARYLPRDYCFGSKARIPLGLSNEIRQNSSQTVPLDWPPQVVGIRLRRVPQQQLEGFRGELFHNSSWKSWCVHGLRCPRHLTATVSGFLFPSGAHGQLHNYLPIGTAGRERGGACAWMLESGIREGGKSSKG